MQSMLDVTAAEDLHGSLGRARLMYDSVFRRVEERPSAASVYGKE
jgi:hypothetical protein